MWVLAGHVLACDHAPVGRLCHRSRLVKALHSQSCGGQHLVAGQQAAQHGARNDVRSDVREHVDLQCGSACAMLLPHSAHLAAPNVRRAATQQGALSTSRNINAAQHA